MTNQLAKSPPMSKSEQKAHTRQKVLQAVLDIVIQDGMRAVRHRAVAKQAGVSLGTTTYHFSDIEDLIVSAFTYWRGRPQMQENPFYLNVLTCLMPYKQVSVPDEKRNAVAMEIYENSVGYVCDQIVGKRNNRLLEIAFHHESMLYPSLRQLMIERWEVEQALLVDVHEIMGSPAAKDDARITFTLFRQLEQSMVMSHLEIPDESLIRSTLHRHMTLCFNAEFTANVG